LQKCVDVVGIQKDARDFETLTVLFNRLATG